MELVDNGFDPKEMLQMALNWLSKEDVKEMLDANELSPRFTEEEHWCEDCGADSILTCSCDEDACTDCGAHFLADCTCGEEV